MNVSQSTYDLAKAQIEKSAPNNKITKGNIERIRRHYITQMSIKTEQELYLLLSDVASLADRHLDRRAANRPTMLEVLHKRATFDFNNIPGCIGFTREIHVV